MSSSSSLAPPGPNLSRFPRRTHRALSDLSSRSRSLPNFKDEPEVSSRENEGTPDITIEDHSATSPERILVNEKIRDEDNALSSTGHPVNGTDNQSKETPSNASDDEMNSGYNGSQSSLPGRSQTRMDSDSCSQADTIDTIVPRRNLSIFDVAALILNKQIGTGIFTTPGAVLAYAKSKPVSIGLWILGGLYTSIFILVYLEFGSALPFNGGELIYLDEMFPYPELLATILFSGFFLILGNSYGNSVTFAKHTMLAANPAAANTAELDSRLVRLIAIFVLSIVCLLHYFSSRSGLFLNRALALFKVILLFTVFVAGVKVAHKKGSGLEDFTEVHGQRSSGDGLAAMVLILYAYQGWENANYVAGEIKGTRSGEGRTPAKTLKLGAFLAVILVSILYVLVTLAYYLACDYDTIIGGKSDLGVALFFAPRAFGSSLGLKVCIALSAFGNLVAVTFTCSKVKQAIAMQRILPFYEFFQKDMKTPKGALLLHWISSVLLIVICPTSADGYNFAVGLFTYGHITVGIFVTFGLYFLPGRMRRTWPNWRPEILTNKWVFMTLPIIFTAGNLIVLYFGAKPQSPGTIPRFWWPVTFFLIIAGSALYWGAMMITQIKVLVHGVDRTVGSIIGFEIKIFNESDETAPWPSSMDQAMAQSRLDGSRRRVAYKFSGIFKSIGSMFHRTKDFLGKYMF